MATNTLPYSDTHRLRSVPVTPAVDVLVSPVSAVSPVALFPAVTVPTALQQSPHTQHHSTTEE